MGNNARVWIEIDLKALRENYRSVRRALKPGCRPIAVVKADAYGLGAVPLAAALEREGCEYFAISDLDEARKLRRGGIRGRILSLSPVTPNRVEEAIENDVEVSAVSLRQIEPCAKAAQACGGRLKIQVKLDVGLTRLGILTAGRLDAAKAEVQAIAALPGVELTAVFTHLTSCELPGGEELDLRELQLYDELTQALRKTGLKFERHCLSSAPVRRYPAYCFEGVRLGSLLYGFHPGTAGGFTTRPVLSMYTHILQIKRVPAGTPVSYGPLFHTLRKETAVAVVTVGFADGLRRSLSNRGSMLLRGAQAPIIGKICCDQTMLDVTDIPEAKEGDVVTIFGTSGTLEQRALDYANLYPATVAELTSAFSDRVARFYCEGEPIIDPLCRP